MTKVNLVVFHWTSLSLWKEDGCLATKTSVPLLLHFKFFIVVE